MKLNHMICPNCGHDFYVNTAYATCDACNCAFYASQSATCGSNGKIHRPSVTNVRVKAGAQSKGRV